MHLFIIKDIVEEITAESILMVSVEILSYPVLFLFGNLDILHITSCVYSYLMKIKSSYLFINKILSVINLIMLFICCNILLPIDGESELKWLSIFC